MHGRHLWILALATAPVALLNAVAQQPKATRPPARADSTKVADSTATDSTAGDADEPEHRITSGVSFGGLSYEGGRSERATSAVLRWRALPWLSMGVTPTFARATEPTGVLGRSASRSGLTDLPLEISADHGFDAPLSPSLGLGIGITLPVGDSASGFGSGAIGSSISIGGGLSLTDRLGVHVGAGRSLTDFSLQSTFNGTSSEFGDAGFSLQANDHLSLSAGLDGDIGSVDPDYGRGGQIGLHLAADRRGHTQGPQMTEPTKSVAVIGAGDHIGAAIVRQFAAEGFAVHAGRRNGDKLAPLLGGAVSGRSLDAREPDDLAAFLTEAEAIAPLV